jgi:hypothetical protein
MPLETQVHSRLAPVHAVARSLYLRSGLDFDGVKQAYEDFGFVSSSPSHLLLFRPAKSDSIAEWLSLDRFAEADTWHVGLAVGDGNTRWFLEQMPWYLPKVSWTKLAKHGKDDGYRIYDTDKLISKIRK